MYLNNNEYLVLECISENVFLVQSQTSTCRYIAKCSPKEDVHKHLFKTELDILVNLKSNYVPKIVDVFFENNQEWLIETYIDGINGREWIKQHPTIYAKNKCIFSLFKILNEIHELGYLYIDLKLENIIVLEKEFYLIDFNSCIERNSRIAYRASKSNCAPELLSLKKKNIEVDVYSMGSLFQVLFKHKFILVYLCHRSSEKRIQTLKILKNLFIGQIVLRFILLLSICCLSVFYIVDAHVPKSIFDQYYRNSDVYLFQKAFEISKEENKEDTLYQWIMKDWIIDEVYKNPQAASYLMDQALLTNNNSMIRYIYEKSEKSLPLLAKRKIDMVLNMNSKTVENYVCCVIDSDLVVQEKMSQLEEILKSCLNKKIVFDLTNLELFVNSININVNINVDSFGTLYLEYILLIQNEQGLKWDCPKLFIEKIKNEEWNALYALWRSSV